MNLKKLYTALLCEVDEDLTVNRFLFAVDAAMGAMLSAAPPADVLCGEDYRAPETLEDPLDLTAPFRAPFIAYLCGCLQKDEAKMKNAQALADRAYLSLWRARAKGKRLKGDRW
ncbi:MAG: hypothetical protein IJS44_02915 [Clostridia bacterium]|nr:hypothetical protein [Clostridia bacterium]